MHLDRQCGNAIVATHDSIAPLLGVRREGVTAAALRLQQAGLIHYTRGRMELRDRAGLEACCCKCYAAVRDTTMQPPVSQPCFAPMRCYGTGSRDFAAAIEGRATRSDCRVASR